MRKFKLASLLLATAGLFGFTINREVLQSTFWSLDWFNTRRKGLLLAKNESHSNNRTVSQQLSSQTPKHGDLFVPGSLSLSKTETLARCYMDPQKYTNHMKKRRKCTISEEYKLIYYQVAKAGSSTARAMMKQSFRSKEQACNSNFTKNDEYFRFTFVREPSSRFVSSYQEMVKRLWKKGAGNNPPTIPAKYDSFMAPYASKSSVKKMSPDQYTKAFVQFVQDYDAMKPFDGHLRLQTPRLILHGRNGELDEIVDTHDMDAHWNSMAKMIHAPTPAKAMHAYSRGSLLNVDLIELKTKRKMCQLSALDYCCLNYPLPSECMPQNSRDEAAVQCRWVSKHDVSDQLLIEDVSPYPPQVSYASTP